MGINNTKLSPNTEDWNNINTADMSSADMKLVNLRSDAQALVSILPNTESETFIDSPTNNLYNRIYLSIKEGNKNSEMARTDTSPFISEDMYNYLVESSSEKNNISESFKFSASSNLNVNVRNNLVGGGKVETSTTLSNLSNIKSNSSNVKIENATSSSKFNDFELEHSSLEYQGDTSSSKKSVLMSDSISSKNSSHANNSSSNNSSSNNSSSNNSSSNNSSYRSSVQKTESLKTVSDVTVTSDYNTMQGGGVKSLKYNSDYESSSAHTSSHSSNNSSIINKESSYNETTISVGNQKILSDSINTSDINIITVDH